MSIIFYSAVDLTILFLNTSESLLFKHLFLNSALIKTLLDFFARRAVKALYALYVSVNSFVIFEVRPKSATFSARPHAPPPPQTPGTLRGPGVSDTTTLT